MGKTTVCVLGVLMMIGGAAWAQGLRPIRVEATGMSKWLPSHSVVFTVSTNKQQTQATALSQNNQIVARLATELTALGLKKSQVRISTPSSSEDWEWTSNRRVNRGYTTSQDITVTVPGTKTQIAGAVSGLAGLTVPQHTAITAGEGWNRYNEVKAAKAQEKAELNAYKALMKKAQRIAKAMGVRIEATPLSVNTEVVPSAQADNYAPRSFRAAAALESAPAAAPVQVSRTEWERVQVTKSATFNIIP